MAPGTLACFWRGAVIATNRDLFPALARQGWRVRAFAPDAPQTGVAGPGTWEPDAHEEQYCRPWPCAVAGHPLLYGYRSLSKLLREVQPSAVLFLEEPYLPATAHALWHCKRLEIPCFFYTAQNLPRAHPWPIPMLERWVLRNAAGAWCVNAASRQRLLALGFQHPAPVLGLGLDPRRFQRRRTAEVANAPLRVAYYGRWSSEKGLDVFLRAVGQVPEIQVVIAGDGPSAEQLRATIAQPVFRERVQLHPPIVSTEVPAWLETVDAVVLPSRTTPRWMEQFGRVLIEAMAMELPVIGSASGEIPEVIGPAGLLVPEGDASALAEALRRLASERALCLQLGQAGRARVLERYTWDQVAKELTALAQGSRQ